MAVKKVTSRTRSAKTTTKRGKSTGSTTTKRAAKPRSAAKRPPAVELVAMEAVEGTPTRLQVPEVAEPQAVAMPPRPRDVSGDDDGRPSRFTGDHYLHVTGPEPAEGVVRRPGKWLIFVSRSRVDALWTDIRRAVRSGRLGHAAKVSTALPNPLSPDPKKHVICVYTADENDAADVRRVRDVLRGLGVTWKIPYKSDAATRAGQHEVTTGGPAAKYYE